MTSTRLEQKFKLVEIAAFQAYLKADDRGKEKICKQIGEWEAKEIIKEIEQQAKNEMAIIS